MEATVYEHLEVLWNYMHLNQQPRVSDCIVGFGCYDEDIPRRCAELFHRGFAPYVVFSGGLGRNTSGLWTGSEAERFARIAMECGVPRERLSLEDRSTNSAENLLFTPKVLQAHGIPHDTILAVHKPNMERRLYVAMQVYWPRADAVYTSPQVSIREHIAHAEASGMTEKAVIETVVGDVQRMKLYAEKGYQIPQEIPDRVWRSYEALLRLGYDGQTVKA